MFVVITFKFQPKLMARFTAKKYYKKSVSLLISDGNECYKDVLSSYLHL